MTTNFPEEIKLFTISQKTPAKFNEIYIGQTFLCFIEAGAKLIDCPIKGTLIAKKNDLIIFPSNSFVSLENRPLLNGSYCALGVYFPHEFIDEVFSASTLNKKPSGICILSAKEVNIQPILELLKETIHNKDLPEPIRRNRLMEPLIWLRHHGIYLPPHQTIN